MSEHPQGAEAKGQREAFEAQAKASDSQDRHTPTSLSAVFLQNCQYSYDESICSLSHTAPSAVFPIFLPSEVVSNGAVNPYTCLRKKLYTSMPLPTG